jgi:UPF0176 protein
MPVKVAALYQFAALPDFRELREPLRALAAGLGIKGSVLLAHEGINGTVAGGDEGIDAFVHQLQHGALFGGRLDNLELKFSSATEMPFQRLKVRLKKEIVTLGDTAVDPTQRVGTYVEPSDWNELISAPDTLVIDTRNAFEVAMGTFEGAIDPGIKSFGQFKEFAAQQLNPAKHRKIAMFCTGGIRCEKASAYLLAQGFSEVYHLKGGILRYLEGVPEQESRWRGECFVFDERVALGHGLRQRQPNDGSMSDADDLSERIDALEMRLTYQDVTIETLNQTITAQWVEIDRLTRQVAELKERLQEAESNAPGPANEPPPHY